MRNIEGDIFKRIFYLLEGMRSPSYDDDLSEDILFGDRDLQTGFILPWVIIQSHDSNLEPISLGPNTEEMKLSTPALFVEYGNLGDQYNSGSKDIPTFLEYPNLGIMREMTEIFLRVVLLDPQDSGVDPITQQIASARHDIRKAIGDNLRQTPDPVSDENPDVSDYVYQAWVGEYIRTEQTFYQDTAEFIIPIDVWWKYDIRDIDREPTAIEGQELDSLEIEYETGDAVVSVTEGVTASLIRKEIYTLGSVPNTFKGNTVTEAETERNLQSADTTWLATYDDDTSKTIRLARPKIIVDSGGTQQQVANTYTVTIQHRDNNGWVDTDGEHTDAETLTSLTDDNWNENVIYQVDVNGNRTPDLRFPYYPTMIPESLYDTGDTPEQKIERKIRQELQKSLDNETYFDGIEKIYSGPLSLQYLKQENLPHICIMFEKTTIDVRGPVPGKNVGFRTANTEDQTLSFVAMVYATADRAFTDPYKNTLIVDNALSDLREFVIDNEAFDNVGGAFSSVIGPINFPRYATDVAGELLFGGSFEFYIRYRPGG